MNNHGKCEAYNDLEQKVPCENEATHLEDGTSICDEHCICKRETSTDFDFDKLDNRGVKDQDEMRTAKEALARLLKDGNLVEEVNASGSSPDSLRSIEVVWRYADDNGRWHYASIALRADGTWGFAG